MERADQVRDGPAPVIQPPDHDSIDGPSPGGPQEFLPLQPLTCPRTELFYHQDNSPPPLLCVRDHGITLEGERLLIMRRNSGVASKLNGFGLPGQKPCPTAGRHIL